MVLSAIVEKSSDQKETEKREELDGNKNQPSLAESLPQEQPKQVNQARSHGEPHENRISIQHDRPCPWMQMDSFIRHPLQNAWTLWFLENDKTRTKPWEELLNEITTFNTVEDFWCIYRHIKAPSEIKAGSDYSLFKKGIRPMWEDAANREGGRWMITLSKHCRPKDLDGLWLDVMLILIGETIENSDHICGAVVNIRSKGAKISVWTADGGNRNAVMEIGNKLRELLRLNPHKIVLVYQLHKDAMVKPGSMIKSTYIA